MNISKIAPNLHYCGKILKQGNNFFSGSFFKTLPSGKSLCLDYKNGLLKRSVISNGEINTKVYDYDNSKRLIKVNNNGKDVFVKEIKNKLGIEFRRSEIINDNIYKSYDRDDNLLFNRILSKALSSNFLHYHSNLLGDVIKEDRYFISNLVPDGKGNYCIKVDKGCPVEPVFEWYKTIYKLLESNHTAVLERDGNKISGFVKDSEGQPIGKLDTLLDRNNNPLWERASNENGVLMDFKSTYSDEGLLEREMSVINLKNIKTVSDKTFDANRNVINERTVEQTISGESNFSYSYARKFDKNNLMTEEKKFKDVDGEKQLVYKINNEYNSQNQLTKKEYYNPKDELETVEYNIFDKENILRVSGYKNFEDGVESGYDVFDKSGNLRKRAVMYEDESVEELYDKEGFLKKWISKDENGIIKSKYEYYYDSVSKMKIKSVKKDKDNNILYSEDILYPKKKGSAKEIKIYKDASGNLLGKQFIYADDIDGYKFIYTNSKGKRCDNITLADALGEDNI